MDRPAAETLAVTALSFIAADPRLFDRFLALTGIDVGGIRHAAATPGFLLGVFDFVLGHEPTLMAFAEDAGIDPARVVAARQALAGPAEAGA
ncbi:DUF3572 domain-containing protein [Aurantimonas sp. A2-1-M11]|uniref:DUF3572 domain-containing protein n=1 Tax=Aurantimonas sp. A2-1-M11 TaxID=3113712 RepID=UPI002F95903F